MPDRSRRSRHHDAARSTRSSTPPTRRCSAAAASTARSIARPGPSSWPRAGRFRKCARRALPDRRGAHHAGISAAGALRDPHGRPGLARRRATANRSCSRAAIANRSSWPRQHAIASIAFPAISCGVYGYPIDQAVAIAVREVARLARDGERAARASCSAASVRRSPRRIGMQRRDAARDCARRASNGQRIRACVIVVRHTHPPFPGCGRHAMAIRTCKRPRTRPVGCFSSLDRLRVALICALASRAASPPMRDLARQSRIRRPVRRRSRRRQARHDRLLGQLEGQGRQGRTASANDAAKTAFLKNPAESLERARAFIAASNVESTEKAMENFDSADAEKARRRHDQGARSRRTTISFRSRTR